jgi:hypothetical protein
MKPIRYRVLLCEQLSRADKLTIAAKVSMMYSGPEAEMHAFRKTKDFKFVNENWQYEILDHMGRVVALKYKGVEVAVFVKRQITEVEPVFDDPIPEGVIKDPQDAWVRLDLLGVSARKASSLVGRQKKSIEEELRHVQRELILKDELLSSYEDDIKRLRKQNAELREKTSRAVSA